MERKLAIVLFLALLLVIGSEAKASMYLEGTNPGEVGDDNFTYLGTPTKWDPGANTASFHGYTAPAGPMTTGGATFSIMGAGLTADAVDTAHTGSTQVITSLGVAGYTFNDYVTLVDSALDVWAASSNFINLGYVADGGVNAGATQASGGHLGDIRIGAWDITAAGVLAHAYQPGTEAIFGSGGTIGGDMHIDTAWTWVDDPTDTTADADYDLFTVVLHELGHSLGLGHSSVVGSVMYPYYSGALRSLTADDIAGIRAIYGVPVPGAVLLGIMGLGIVGIRLRKYA